MEKTLSPDERIRRAEEIYYRKKMQTTDRKSTRVNVTDKKDFGMLKKMILQILICILIYSIFYMIQNTDYIFSENVIKKVNEILSYDINIKKLYEESMQYINGFLNNNTTIDNEYINTDNLNEIENSESNIDNTNINNENIYNQDSNILQEDNIGGETVDVVQEENTALSQMEQDAKYISSNKSLIIPLKGTITSRYGLRNPQTPTVPKNHTGIDIAVNEGTVFIASMSGTVKEVSSKGDLGNHVKVTSDDVMTVYAHCKTIYVKEGDTITQGQAVGEVGSTGNVTGPHLHFEIRRENRYVNPDLILDFD